MITEKKKFLKITDPTFLDAMDKIIRNGFQEFQTACKSARHVSCEYQSSTKAMMVNDHIYSHLESELPQIEKTVIRRDGNSRFLVRENCLFRVKKFDRRLRTSNNPTRTSESFDCNTLELEDMEKVTCLYVGYLPDPTYSRIIGTFVTCPCAEGLHWVLNIGRLDELNFSHLPTIDLDDGTGLRIKTTEVFDDEETADDVLFRIRTTSG